MDSFVANFEAIILTLRSQTYETRRGTALVSVLGHALTHSVNNNFSESVEIRSLANQDLLQLKNNFTVFFSRPTPIGGREIHIG